MSRSTASPSFRTLLAVLLPILLTAACGPGRVSSDSLLRQAEFYASRCAFQWQNLDTFLMRGNARLQGSNLVARGPFVLWGDGPGERLRGDFYGPDGHPVVSVQGDSTGILLYLPRDEAAVFMPMGLQSGGGTLATADLVHLLRTGFPAVMEAWQMVDAAGIDNGRLFWRFITSDSSETMVLSMEDGDLFPYECSWISGYFTIEASSPHDEYRAWPWCWTISVDSQRVELELTEVGSAEIPHEGIWGMNVPVPVDTVVCSPLWQSGRKFDIR